MNADLRDKIHQAVDELPTTHLVNALRLIEFLASQPSHSEVEFEELWLLANGGLK
jgi:hypothetical protein